MLLLLKMTTKANKLPTSDIFSLSLVDVVVVVVVACNCKRIKDLDFSRIKKLTFVGILLGRVLSRE